MGRTFVQYRYDDDDGDVYTFRMSVLWCVASISIDSMHNVQRPFVGVSTANGRRCGRLQVQRARA